MNKRDQSKLVKKVNDLIKPFGCSVTGIGPDSVGVLGDARVYGTSLTIKFPPDATSEQIGTVATKVVNEVRGVVRILLDIGS